MVAKVVKSFGVSSSSSSSLQVRFEEEDMQVSLRRPASFFSVSIHGVVFLSMLFVGLQSCHAQHACFWCPDYPQVSRRIENAPWLVLAECVQRDAAKPDESSAAVFKITKIEKGSKTTVKNGQLVSHRSTTKKGVVVLFIGTRVSKINPVEWSLLAETPASIAYCLACSKLKEPVIEQLRFYAKHLEHSDTQVATDAYYAMKLMPVKNLQLLAKLPDPVLKKKLLECTTLNQMKRRDLYGLVLGFCGNADDAKQLEQTILKQTIGSDFRPGREGVMTGYLLLTGEPGLDFVDKHVLKNRDIAFSEIYAALQAMRMLWDFEGRPIKRERLLQSMQLLLDNPDLTDLVIGDFSRFKVWILQEQIVAFYGKEGFEIPAIKREIIRYLIYSSGELAKPKDGAAEKLLNHQIKAREHLKVIRKRDPKIAAAAKRFFLLQ